MNKHTIITISAIAVIIGTLGYSALNIIGASQITFRWSEQDNYSFYYLTTSDNKLEICNPLFTDIRIDSLNIAAYYQSEKNGDYTIKDIILQPGTNIASGEFRSDTYAGTQYLFMEFDAQFSKISQTRFDPDKIAITLDMDTPILGIIPYKTSMQYSGEEFYNIMNNENFVC